MRLDFMQRCLYTALTNAGNTAPFSPKNLIVDMRNTTQPCFGGKTVPFSQVHMLARKKTANQLNKKTKLENKREGKGKWTIKFHKGRGHEAPGKNCC